MFRKNKIQSVIDNNTVAYNSADFDSLDIVKKKLKSKRLWNRMIIDPSAALIQDIKLKYQRTTKYIINHVNTLFTWSLYILILATFIILNILLFNPFYGAIANETWTIINNFWTAAYANNSLMYAITPLGISFIVVFLCTIGIFVWYFLYTKKHNKHWIDNKTKTNSILSYTAYGLIAVSILLILIIVLIPPSANSLMSEQNLTNAFAYIQFHQGAIASADEVALRNAITLIYTHYGHVVPTGLNIEDQILRFYQDNTAGLFLSSVHLNNYWFFADVYRSGLSQLSIIGIVITTFYAVFIATGAIILPSTIIYLNVLQYYKINSTSNADWNIWTLFIYRLMRIFSKNYKQAFANRKIKRQDKKAAKKLARENNQTYAKFKKQNREQGLSITEASFNSNQLDNAAVNIITKEQIEAHEPNKAFLNADGDWMYHDGAGNYFVAKNDAWIKFDVTKVIHKVHADANNKLDLDPSKKQYKEGRFKKAKHKKSTPIALPDDDLDEIIKKLDI